METQSLRPDLQPFAPTPQIVQHEITNHPPSVSQLKQEPTVNHQPILTPQNTSASAPEKHPRSAVHPPTPPSDHPITQTPDHSQSQQDPKPSSDSTDPLPPLPNPKQSPQQNKLPSTSVRTSAEQPLTQVEKPVSLDKTQVPSRPTSYLRSRLPFVYYDDDIDQDEDFERYYSTFLRKKTESEMAPAPPQPLVKVEPQKKPRSTRQSNNKVQKRKVKEALREIPFSDPKYHKTVGPMVLRPNDIARDLAKIYGREYKEPVSSAAKPPLRPGDRKRQRGPDASGSGNGAPNGKRLRTAASSTDSGDKNASLEAGRVTRYAKRSNTQAGMSNGERGNHGGHKRARTGVSTGSVGELDQKKMFEKHPDRKGWVVCKKCDAAVWPPNCGKHLYHCGRSF